MSLFIDKKYANLVSHELQHFKWKDEYLANFRALWCCGDSQKNTKKKRGYLVPYKGSLFYKCHNCGISKSFGAMLKEHNPNLYTEYKIEKYKDASSGTITASSPLPIPKQVEKINQEIDYSDLIRYDELRSCHPAHKFLHERKICSNMLENFYYAPDFYKWASKYKPEFCNAKEKVPRLIIPFFDEHGKSYIFQARTYDPTVTPKYYTIKSYEEATKIYGLNTIDKNQKVYVFEGPIDSMFIKNSVAVCSSSLNSTLYKYDTKIKSPVFVWDNEPRNKEIVKLIEQAIDDGHHVVIWPSYISHKDINDCIISGYEKEDLELILKNHVYHGMRAKLEFSKWKKV